jgi:hypothetical protein
MRRCFHWAKFFCDPRPIYCLTAPHKIHNSEQASPSLGVRAWGDAMTDTESGNERRHQVERYRVLERETTEPLAALLLHDIVLELEADLKEPQRDSVEGNA